MSLAYEVNEFLYALGRDDLKVIPCYVLEDIKETLKQAATDIDILIGRERKAAKKAAENGVDAHISLESFYRFDLENVNRVIKKLSSL